MVPTLPPRTHRHDFGFTMLEILIAISVIVIIAAIAVPQYFSSLRQARIDKARSEVVTIAQAIETYADQYGKLPLTLYQVGFGGRLDPWGVPYCYLNYTDGTGDGLTWAVEAGIVDPAAFVQRAEPTPAPAPEETTPTPTPGPVGGAVGGLLGGLGGGGAVGEVVATAEELVQAVVGTLVRQPSGAETRQLADVATRYPGIQVFTSVTVNDVRRRDRYMFPLNTDYDLFSLGPNRRTATSLGAANAQDDVIRANDGGYFGVASAY